MLKLGDKIEPYGKIVMIGWVGERYYWFQKGDVISMIPASTIMCMMG